jgi:hypothetical protein
LLPSRFQKSAILLQIAVVCSQAKNKLHTASARGHRGNLPLLPSRTPAKARLMRCPVASE